MSDVTVTETVNEVTVSHEAVAVTATAQETPVTVNPGISDHGQLAGLTDDDHTQYLTTARHAAIGSNPHGVTASDVGALPLTGGTMTGALILDADPSAALEAATKQYVDNNAGGASDVGDLTTVGLTAGNMLRIAAAGGLEERTPAQVLADIGAAASGHNHAATYVDVTGDTMTGALAISMAGTPAINANSTSTGDLVMADFTHDGNPGAGRHSIRLGRAAAGRNIEIGVYSPDINFSGPQFAVYNNEAAQYVLLAGGGKLGIGNITTLTATIEGRYATAADYLVMNLLNTHGSSSGSYDQVIRIGRETGSRYLDFGTRSAANSVEPAFLVKREDAHTNRVYTLAILDFRSLGAPAAGLGVGMNFQLESSTTVAQNAARIVAVWSEATHATRKADLVLSAYDTAEREGLRIRATGSAALLITDLPTSDPGVTGALWSDSGTVKVSSG